ncbi:Hypothetical Protein SiL_2366 [Sulfolobus islandicus LAL14/1]|uniref:Uncharacterized protein n=1 Tax=Saccharolobus islandicus LAL14/1 TaxID=1241935 RepID=M9UCD5_SACIS|nr:Hypothetical Protein SiL_2366 [Sulfolobus islandicus LAL14/1]
MKPIMYKIIVASLLIIFSGTLMNKNLDSMRICKDYPLGITRRKVSRYHLQTNNKDVDLYSLPHY